MLERKKARRVRSIVRLLSGAAVRTAAPVTVLARVVLLYGG